MPEVGESNFRTDGCAWPLLKPIQESLCYVIEVTSILRIGSHAAISRGMKREWGGWSGAGRMKRGWVNLMMTTEVCRQLLVGPCMIEIPDPTNAPTFLLLRSPDSEHAEITVLWQTLAASMDRDIAA